MAVLQLRVKSSHVSFIANSSTYTGHTEELTVQYVSRCSTVKRRCLTDRTFPDTHRGVRQHADPVNIQTYIWGRGTPIYTWTLIPPHSGMDTPLFTYWQAGLSSTAWVKSAPPTTCMTLLILELDYILLGWAARVYLFICTLIVHTLHKNNKIILCVNIIHS